MSDTLRYVDLGLRSARDFRDQIAFQLFHDFTAAPSPRGAYAAAVALFHLIDWLWHDEHPSLNNQGRAWQTFRDRILAECPALVILRDVAEASKHRGLGRKGVAVER